MHIFPRGLLEIFLGLIATKYDNENGGNGAFATGAHLSIVQRAIAYASIAMTQAITELPTYPGLRKPTFPLIEYYPSRKGPYRNEVTAHVVMPSVDLMDDLQQRIGFLMAKIK